MTSTSTQEMPYMKVVDWYTFCPNERQEEFVLLMKQFGSLHPDDVKYWLYVYAAVLALDLATRILPAAFVRYSIRASGIVKNDLILVARTKSESPEVMVQLIEDSFTNEA